MNFASCSGGAAAAARLYRKAVRSIRTQTEVP